MRETFATLLALAAGLFVMFTCVDYANAKEPITLDEAIERPVKVKSFVDKKNSVVCYYFGTHPNYLNCVYIPRNTELSRGAK
jgi:hypothetical protein